ncbi:hypothetical protein M433DRAFT_162476 [Acidomyces richmondensis BFW]|nr:MAG: hypothetical protein FE78DRAFT_109600 [Acidomyces sp. 'richmondensis']KYG49560.1 hypothetical protein M433DRAFT_162476 [Acidomyces richmondensis BFW]
MIGLSRTTTCSPDRMVARRDVNGHTLESRTNALWAVTHVPSWGRTANNNKTALTCASIFQQDYS